MKKQIKTIRIIWTENNSTKDRDYPNLDRVNSDLRHWAKSAPNDGCYDKTKFLVTWEDGQTWEGRIDLQRQHAEQSNIVGKHITDFCKFYLGLARPAHMSEKQYSEFLERESRLSSAMLADLKEYMDDYDMGEV